MYSRISEHFGNLRDIVVFVTQIPFCKLDFHMYKIFDCPHIKVRFKHFFKRGFVYSRICAYVVYRYALRNMLVHIVVNYVHQRILKIKICYAALFCLNVISYKRQKQLSKIHFYKLFAACNLLGAALELVCVNVVKRRGKCVDVFSDNA